MYQTSYAYLADVSNDVQGGTSALKNFIGIDKFESTATTAFTKLQAHSLYASDTNVRNAVNQIQDPSDPTKVISGSNPMLISPLFAGIMSMVFVPILITVNLAWLQVCTMDISPTAIT